jgi:hypothetical protein
MKLGWLGVLMRDGHQATVQWIGTSVDRDCLEVYHERRDRSSAL